MQRRNDHIVAGVGFIAAAILTAWGGYAALKWSRTHGDDKVSATGPVMSSAKSDPATQCSNDEVALTTGLRAGRGTLAILTAIDESDALEETVLPAAPIICIQASNFRRLAARAGVASSDTLRFDVAFDPDVSRARREGNARYFSIHDEVSPAPDDVQLGEGVWLPAARNIRVAWYSALAMTRQREDATAADQELDASEQQAAAPPSTDEQPASESNTTTPPTTELQDSYNSDQ